jgi:amidase
VIELNPTALKLAADLDAQRKAGKKLGPLHGIPILVKDNIATRFEDGMNTTAGSYALLNSVVPGDATVTAKLRQVSSRHPFTLCSGVAHHWLSGRRDYSGQD